MKALFASCVICLLSQLFTLYAYVSERRAYIGAMSTLGVCEVSIDKATRLMTRKQRWKYESLINDRGVK